MPTCPDPPPTATPQGRLRIRVMLGGGPFGPGKADLLEAIGETGSIAAAGRRLGMSYQRAWSLVDAMNGQFAEPVVSGARGGAQGGGSALTPFGREVLAAYRRIVTLAEGAAAGPIACLEARHRESGGPSDHTK